MKLHLGYLLASLCLPALSGPLSSHASTVWTGPLITYTQPAPDPSQAANQDQLTENVSITRLVNSGIFNGVTESAYAHHVSPADTEWAVGSLDNYTNLVYSDWEA